MSDAESSEPMEQVEVAEPAPVEAALPEPLIVPVKPKRAPRKKPEPPAPEPPPEPPSPEPKPKRAPRKKPEPPAPEPPPPPEPKPKRAPRKKPEAAPPPPELPPGPPPGLPKPIQTRDCHSLADFAAMLHQRAVAHDASKRQSYDAMLQDMLA